MTMAYESGFELPEIVDELLASVASALRAGAGLTPGNGADALDPTLVSLGAELDIDIEVVLEDEPIPTSFVIRSTLCPRP